MGFTRVRFTISHPIDLGRSAEVELLVDTGALNSFVPRPILEDLGIPSYTRRAFRLANGHTLERDVGLAIFRWNGHEGGAPVVFAEPGDDPLLGVTALETMALAVDPTTHTLKPADTYRV